MGKRLQVFISSTFDDLREERQAAIEAILKGKHIPAGMESFTGENLDQLQVINTWIDESDVFLLIIGCRYGSIRKNGSKSYTELEFEYARSIGKPMILCIMSEEMVNEKVTNYFTLAKTDDTNKYKEFREYVLEDCGYRNIFNSIDELKYIIGQSLANMQNNPENKFIGWTRGSGFDQLLSVRGDMIAKSLIDRLKDYNHIRILGESSYNLLSPFIDIHTDLLSLCKKGIRFDFISINPDIDTAKTFIYSIETESLRCEEYLEEIKTAKGNLRRLTETYSETVRGRLFDYFFPYAMMLHYVESVNAKNDNDYIKLDLYSVRTSDNERRVIHFHRRDLPNHFRFFENEYNYIFEHSGAPF